MKILVINSGSTSLKAQLVDPEKRHVYANITIRKIGLKEPYIKYKAENKDEVKAVIDITDHKSALEVSINYLLDKKFGVIKSLDEIDAIGHRMVHGGEEFTSSVEVTNAVLKKLKQIVDMAPLHNPAAIMGMEASMSLMPNKKNVVVFDTAFHSTMPEISYLYALPLNMYEDYKIRRYGFHGTSHRYVSGELAKIVGGLKGKKVISCHLGGGSSVTAIMDGKSIDTSMGYTPLAGVVMGSRSGDIDPAIIEVIMNKTKMSIGETISFLNKECGIQGISNLSSDMMDIEKNITDHKCKLAFDMMNYSIKKYIGAYASVMNGVDYIIFTGGIGENDELVRQEILKGLTYLGVELDEKKNLNLPRNTIELITTPKSKVKVYRIPTDEEYLIALDTMNIVKNANK